jgi:hypothetical protein
MEYNISMEPENRFVLIEESGTGDLEETIHMTRDALAFGSRTGCSRYLVDCRKSPMDFSTIDTFQFITGLEDLGVPRYSRIAVVYALDHSKHRFAENVAVNRGWSIRYFEDYPEAVRWLESGIDETELPDRSPSTP